MSRIRVFDKDFLVGELGLPDECIEPQIIGNTRWSLRFRGVFAHEGKHYRVTWSQGATEAQDEQPWEYEDKVEATEVVKRPVTVEQWVPVEDEASHV